MAHRAGTAEKRRALLVDDDPLFRQVARLALERAGAEVASAASIAEALAQLDAGPFDLAALDYFLGAGRCGCELIGPLRARWPAVRIAVVSGLGTLPDLIHDAHRAGADLVVCKTQVDWPALLRGERGARRPVQPAVDLAEWRRQIVYGAFLVHRRNVSDTARALGISRSTLQRMLRKRPATDPDP